MTFSFPPNPSNNQIVETPLGQKFIFVSVDDGWRSLGPSKSPAGSAGVSISATVFFINVPVDITLTASSSGTGNGINPPFTFVITSGALPMGLTLTSYGDLFGTPVLSNEEYSFTVSVLDSLSFLINTIIFSGTVSSTLTGDALTVLTDTFAPKISPIFTGTPTTPTPAVGDNSLKIANTAFVASAINNAISGYNFSGIAALQTTIDGMRATITAIQTASANSASSIASLTTTVSALSGLTTLQATVNSEILARVGADNALASDIEIITATVGNNTTAIQNEVTARTTAIDALATSLTTLTTTVNNNTATSSTQTSSTSTALSAMANTITSLTATVNDNTAAISAETNARADLTSATATSITNLVAKVNDNSASIQTNETAIATLDGYVSASYGVTLDSNNYVTGFQVLNGGTPASSSFVVRADTFAVVAPGSTTAEPMFSVTDVSGVPTVSITGNIIYNGVAALTLTFPPQTTWYVDFQNGSDTTGDGKTTGTAWATLQHAVNTVSANYVYSGTMTIKCGNGTLTVASGGWALILQPSNIGSWYILGNTASPSSCVINATAIGARGIASSGPQVNVAGFQISAYYEAITSNGHSNMYVANLNIIGGGTSSYAFGVYTASYITFYKIDGIGINISGTFNVVFSINNGSMALIGWADKLTSSPCSFNFSSVSANSIAQCIDFGSISVNPSYATFSGSATGLRYYVSQGNIDTMGSGENYFPGSVAGAKVNYGVYL